VGEFGVPRGVHDNPVTGVTPVNPVVRRANTTGKLEAKLELLTSLPGDLTDVLAVGNQQLSTHLIGAGRSPPFTFSWPGNGRIQYKEAAWN
jgi:hypothetical protein